MVPLVSSDGVPGTMTPFWDTCRAPRVEVGSMAWLRKSVTVEVTGTLVAPFPGRCPPLITDGRELLPGAPVVNCVCRFANAVLGTRALPERSWIPLVAVTM